ncbi:TPA: energy-dependent translational throttle protein EttA [Legionella pneumophila subsp. pneumophila]|uniref:Energy-dependent translational throttle protein EttA n=2 Tax=Legionella pneumophila TaxID=446 RepID=A0A4Q5N592_LEGPN|nr:energy-dependent translational throttle protein EttA [Legionella pneumophila]MDC8030752.1 energy-dependent translational throttle protein EttA [Legionella pneumophila subsp. pneumophila]MDW8870656.1 energy-dependent translational throttle protein EttA [Legionella pneumophila]MDW8916692.1 energy-dependent translational throttle protein EttA [Legionella pneumophila]MDW8926175.1 energy-dependent translational throttle protein EttA [Legionella pneumophila]MDW8932250.1 energy-dependent translati
MAQYIFTMNRVSKIVENQRFILKDISLSFFPGAKIGVLGLNGSGKSTLLRIMAGVDTQYEGEARPQPGIKIGYLAQEPELDLNKTVREIVEEGVAEIKEKLSRFDAISMRFAEPMSDDEMNALLTEQGELQNEIEACGGWDLERKLDVAADALRLPDWDAIIEKLSGGERRRVALCRLLLSSPDMLLLDEPTNHLDAESVAWLEHYLEEFTGTVVAITHDRYFLDNAAEWILELDRGEGIPYKGNYSSWLEQKEARLSMEKKQEDALQRAIKAELEWVRTSPKGRHAKNKARLARFEEMNSKEFQKRNETNEIYIPPGERLGDLVLEGEKICKSYGDRILIDNFDFKLPKGGILGIIGPNGAGKSTFLKMLTGQEEPDKGVIRIGETVKLAYVDQMRDNLNPNNSVWQEISDGHDIMQIGNFQMPSRAYVGRFNFKGTDQQKKISQLSGGERNRVHLAKLLKSGGNVLLLDEPSNDLDVETLRALEEAILNFPGCAIVISHDRWFLDRICTHLMAFEGDSQITFFEGNYSEYEADRKRRLGDEANRPSRIKYRKLSD